ncbi:MAG TPA: ferrous iron transport protein A [Candidatus Pullichristensenella excrementigallinarum]|uniref:Ferrous iron transport protein A n=1 Tax=Candidatus Pullichristensenella excrementigallinarum TaxID=2840907 RepID=A0A9D1I8W1_9FIRM|nr:ferrous iron transport protein A [Candidatus Pullichristensenella excrementigallinarum]
MREEWRVEISLDRLRDGEAGVVERLELEGPTKRRLIEMGITPGTRVRVLKRAPLGDPIEIFLRRYSLTLRAEDARRIFVRRLAA